VFANVNAGLLKVTLVTFYDIQLSLLNMNERLYTKFIHYNSLPYWWFVCQVSLE